MNLTPEQKARLDIDAALVAADFWSGDRVLRSYSDKLLREHGFRV